MLPDFSKISITKIKVAFAVLAVRPGSNSGKSEEFPLDPTFIYTGIKKQVTLDFSHTKGENIMIL